MMDLALSIRGRVKVEYGDEVIYEPLLFTTNLPYKNLSFFDNFRASFRAVFTKKPKLNMIGDHIDLNSMAFQKQTHCL